MQSQGSIVIGVGPVDEDERVQWEKGYSAVRAITEGPYSHWNFALSEMLVFSSREIGVEAI